MTFLYQKYPEAFYFPKIVKSKNLDKNSMQDKRGSEPMLVCCVVFLRWTPLLCCDTIDVMKDDNNIVHRWKHAFGRVFLTFVSTWLHCTRIGSRWDRFRKKQMPENNSLIMWSPFKVIFFSQKWEEIWQNRWFFSSMVWCVGDEISHRKICAISEKIYCVVILVSRKILVEKRWDLF